MKTNTLTLLLLVFITSCSSFKNNKAKSKAGIVRVPQFEGSAKGTFLWSHYDATKRGALMYIDKNENIRVLAENPPDAAIQSITQITASANVDGKVYAKLAFETSKSIAQLGKRTAAVNMLRDALYRLNELYYATRDEKRENLNILFSKNLGINTDDMKNAEFKELLTSIQNLDELFTNVINNAKEIAIKEAESDKEAHKAEFAKNESLRLKMAVYEDAYKKLKDTLSKKERLYYLKRESNKQ